MISALFPSTQRLQLSLGAMHSNLKVLYNVNGAARSSGNDATKGLINNEGGENQQYVIRRSGKRGRTGGQIPCEY